MASYPLIVAQYDLKGHPRRKEHWSLVALQDANNAFEFELAGSWSNYQYMSVHTTRFGRNQTLRGGCQVGSIPVEKISWLKTRLKDVAIVFSDINFDAQNWVLNALKMMEADGISISLTNEKAIRKEMVLERERWDSGDNTVEDRLFEK